MNWTQLIIVSVFALALVIFLIIQNRKDRKELENNLNSNYPISSEEKYISDVDQLYKNVH